MSYTMFCYTTVSMSNQGVPEKSVHFVFCIFLCFREVQKNGFVHFPTAQLVQNPKIPKFLFQDQNWRIYKQNRTKEAIFKMVRFSDCLIIRLSRKHCTNLHKSKINIHTSHIGIKGCILIIYGIRFQNEGSVHS